MHLLQSGADITVIPMWWGHESTEPTQLYMTGNPELKEKAIAALQPPRGGAFRFRPNVGMISFLESL